MGLFTWGMLPKSQTDPEKIEEAIDRKTEAHNENPEAHLLPGQSLQSHKMSEIIDHRAESIVNDKIISFARAFTFIVDADGRGDYTDIQSAINAAHALGGGNILILPGTYVQSADIVLYNNVSLIGFDRETVVIDFNATNRKIYLAGSPDFYREGTISISNGSLIVTGVDTYFLSGGDLAAGDYIRIGEAWYEILSVNSDTQITLKETFRGRTLTAVTYRSGRFVHGVEIKNLTIKNSLLSGGVAIKFDLAFNFSITDCFIDNNRRGIHLFGCYKGLVARNIIRNSVVQAISVDSSDHTYIFQNDLSNNNSEGIRGHGSVYLVISSNRIINCGDAGIFFSSVENSSIIDNFIENNALRYGIALNGDSHRNVIRGNQIRRVASSGIRLMGFVTSFPDQNMISSNKIEDNGGWGIRIDNSLSEQNIILGNQLRRNASGGISNLGTFTEIAHNITA